ncbi:MAG: helix-turn-helix transcriptional regulator [Planctomycetes bacterium]|nr:helix-turn-helix transcriptional regulator [Planctomycetota bacterium]
MGYEELTFRHIGLSSDKSIVFCELSTGSTYAMPMTALEGAEEWDGSPVVAADILNGGYAGMVRLKSGACIDFPADFVLHECEPSYAYFKLKEKARAKIGGRIKARREAMGLSLSALADATGIAKPNLSRLEHNKVTPQIETLERIARALGATARELLSRK